MKRHNYETTAEKEDRKFKEIAKDALTDKEYKEMLRRTRGGKPCVGCDD